MSLFNAWYTKSTAIEEFEVAQNQTLDQVGNGLRDNWITAVQLAFKSSFKDVGKSPKCLMSLCSAQSARQNAQGSLSQESAEVHICIAVQFQCHYALSCLCVNKLSLPKFLTERQTSCLCSLTLSAKQDACVQAKAGTT